MLNTMHAKGGVTPPFPARVSVKSKTPSPLHILTSFSLYTDFLPPAILISCCFSFSFL